MAITTGLVQRVYIDSGTNTEISACVFIGPAPSNVELLFLRRRATDAAHTGAFLSSMLDALTQALAARHEVAVGHADTDAYIYSVEMR